ncbi:hypothetical protein BGW38_005598 [Lunasporangiospora selenospora]|uniref:Domain of unknown function at the cortex 1 domain-containing protein n=1 Tax=Lunasporangiospora selenospora TaxID=979761 RepID=A0A9P6KAR7_9FUNG|nr:hypothetical protein BGW38_005598 [Lunasporangiospora selenospora]
MVKLRVSVGGTYTDLAIINCNDELHPVEFDGPEFKGRALVRIKDFVGITSDGSKPIHNSDYFKGHNRRFSIQVEGQFKRAWHGDQVYFGTDFDHPADLPQGFNTMLKIARYIDPVVRTSVTEDGKPWILSPLVSSINTMNAWRPQDAILPSPPMTPRHSSDMSRVLSITETSHVWGIFGKSKKNRLSHHGSAASIASNSSQDLYSSVNSSTERIDSPRDESNFQEHRRVSSGENSNLSTGTSMSDADGPGASLGAWRQSIEEDTTFFMPKKPTMTTPQRRKHFQSEEHRREFVFNPELVHGFEFFSPHMDFNTFDIRLGLSMNIRKYLRGQPVRYTCRTLDGSTVFWAVQFELVE